MIIVSCVQPRGAGGIPGRGNLAPLDVLLAEEAPEGQRRPSRPKVLLLLQLLSIPTKKRGHESVGSRVKRFFHRPPASRGGLRMHLILLLYGRRRA